MHILILGAKGMLGRALQKTFESDEVIAWDRDELDITNKDQVMEHILGADPDLVINAAAYTNVEKAEDEEEIAAKINGEAVGYLAEACNKEGVPLVHISTDYVFNAGQKEGYAEDAVAENPINAYGRTKLLGEKLLREKTDKFWLIRTAWLFGPYGNNFVETMINLGKEKKELKVVCDQHGSPTYTRDLTQAIFKMTHEQVPFGIYHLTNSGNTTWADFAKEIFKQEEMQVNVVPVASEEYPTKALRPQWSVLKNTKRPLLRSWQEALKDYLNIRNIQNP
jgi:dTDP-4-dehydrorhamnose reductase